MYADFTFYVCKYGGRGINEGEWPRLSREADAYLDRITFQRLKNGWPVTDEVRRAACALAEAFRERGIQDKKRLERLGITREDNDGYGVSYVGNQEIDGYWEKKLAYTAGLYLPESDPLRYVGLYGGHYDCQCGHHHLP